MSTTSNEKVLYTVKEVSELLLTNTNYVYALIKTGLLPTVKFGTTKIRKVDFDKFLEDCVGKDLTDPNNVCIITYGDDCP